MVIFQTPDDCGAALINIMRRSVSSSSMCIKPAVERSSAWLQIVIFHPYIIVLQPHLIHLLQKYQYLKKNLKQKLLCCTFVVSGRKNKKLGWGQGSLGGRS